MLFLGLLFGDHETQKQQQSSSKSDNSCISDWRQCETNSALVNDYAHISSIIRECESKAEEMAKYGEPEFPWGSFSTYLQGADYIKDGKLVLIEEDAQFENGFGATVNTSVRCTYDLRTEEVVGMDID
jgi:hypothetical protein